VLASGTRGKGYHSQVAIGEADSHRGEPAGPGRREIGRQVFVTMELGDCEAPLVA
jgi:hypothetical protein